MNLESWLAGQPNIAASRYFPAASGERAPWPEWVPDVVRDTVMTRGISAPWVHQARAADLAWHGQHVAISTPTASGKSLAYLLPIMSATAVPASQVNLPIPANDRRSRLGIARHRALYISPTKALAHDQMHAARRLGPRGWQVGALDGDSDTAARHFARDYAELVFTNPDMLHRSILPFHTKWQSLLSSLRFVVIDEAHRYKGVFGSHVACVIRRLRRLCAQYGAHPVFILSSATSTDAGDSGALLIGEDEPLAVVANDTSAHSARTVMLWTPSASASDDAARLMADAVDHGQRVITFVPSRRQAELVAMHANDAHTSAATIASYRSGYLPSDRRAIEADLRDGRVHGVATTNALELGIDISGVDAVLITGFPGRLSSFWQQAGRAGRGDTDAVVILLAKDDPLDAHLFSHPELIFDTPVEPTVLHPSNRYVLAPHLAAAAQEAPLSAEDERWFGPTLPTLADELTAQGALIRRPTGWYWPHAELAVNAIDLRASSGNPVEIVEDETGSVIGSVDVGSADRSVHEGAIYLHQGEQWRVTRYEPRERLAFVTPDQVPYYTQALSDSDVRILSRLEHKRCGETTVCFGEVELSTQTMAYLRRDIRSQEVWDQTPLDLPIHTMKTHGMWWEIPASFTSFLGFSPVDMGSAAHGAEHTAIGLLPLFAPCDRWDVGGLSTILHPDTLTPTIFVHDGVAGGSGFAERGYHVAEAWLRATAERLASCECDDGCPQCVVSPKCGNANQMLDKQAALALVRAMLS